MQTRIILHVDMDAFYASVEQRDNPEIRDRPVVVGGGSNRGVVAAASYEAREFGIHSAMPMAQAKQLCPALLRVAPRMSHYKLVSNDIFDVFREFTPLVEGLSLDEAFLDVTASRKLFGSGHDIAVEIKRRINGRTKLTASVGLAENKLCAKIASDMDKPDGLVVITASNVHTKLDPLPVAVLPGIGRETLSRLQAANIRTIAELRHAADRDIEPIFGRYTQKTRSRAAGIDDRPVVPSRAEKSISAEETYDHDLDKRQDMERELLRLTERTSKRLRKAGLQAGTVQVKIRQSDFRTVTRQRALRPPDNGTDQIFAIARELLLIWLTSNPRKRVRLLGVGGTNLAPAEQRDLFSDANECAGTTVDRTVDEIRDRFGDSSMSRARILDRP